MNAVPILNPPDRPIIGISMVLFANGRFGLSLITAMKLHPCFLDVDFTEIPAPSKMIPYLNSVQPHNIYSEGHLIVTFTSPVLIVFVIPTDCDNFQRFYGTQHSFMLSDDVTGFCAFHEFAPTYNQRGDLQVFIDSKEGAPVAQFSVPGAIGFEYDSDAGELYAVFPRSVHRLRFDSTGRTRGADAIRLWMDNHFLAQKLDEDGIAVLSRVSLPFDEILKMVGKSEEQRLRLLRRLLVPIHDRKIRNSRAVAIAVLAVDLCARVESMRAKPSPSEFVRFATTLLADQLVDMATVQRVLLDYGWESPLTELADAETLFNKLMERGDYKRATDQMKKMPEDTIFCTSALRLFSHEKEEVVKALERKGSLENAKLAPILMSEEARGPVVSQLFQTGRLTKPWLCRAYSIVVSRNPQEGAIEQFFQRFANGKDGDIPAMSRCLIAEKQYLMLAYGLRANRDLVGAVAVAAQGDAVSAFDVIPLNTEPELKKRCATRILRSLKRERAELVARKLVDGHAGAGVDVPTLLQFLPDDLPIAKLDAVLTEFTRAKRVAEEEQTKRFTGSRSGIEGAQKLIASRTEKISSLSSTEPCEHCKRPFFSEPGIVYPCSHMLHLKCAEKLIKKVSVMTGDEPIDIKADCPFSGFLSVRLLDSPFAKRPEGRAEIDPWSTDFDALLADPGIWKLLSGLKF
jgi:hypothetical protein